MYKMWKARKENRHKTVLLFKVQAMECQKAGNK